MINLLDNNGQKVGTLSDDNALLGFYGAQNGYSLHVGQIIYMTLKNLHRLYKMIRIPF